MDNLTGIDWSLIGETLFGPYIDAFFAGAFLLGHFSRRLRLLPLRFVILAMSPTIFLSICMVVLEMSNWRAHVIEILIYTACYGVYIFIAISEWLMRGGASRLTEKRGDKWPKEIDYLYLLLTACGVAVTLARAPSMAENLAATHTLSALLVVTALVLRLIKTRAEVNDWDKPNRGIDPTGDAMIATQSASAPS